MGLNHKAAPLVIDQLLDREYFGMKLGLESISDLLAQLDNPQNNFHSIHVAGTNGKGSTATMMARILEASGRKVGLFTSPHLHAVNERFQINGQFISDHRLNRLAQKIQQLDESRKPAQPLSFFEFITALAFLYFSEEAVDVAVIEVGLGGRLDATNVLLPQVSVITSIAHDHEKYLGNKLEDIAAEKAGIIKPQVPVVCGGLKTAALKVIEQVAAEQQAPLVCVDAPASSQQGSFNLDQWEDLWVPLLGENQLHNGAIAVRAVQQYEQQLSCQQRLPRQAYYRGLAASTLPARMEIIHRCPLVLIDGAHNPAALTALIKTCQQIFSGKRIHCLFGAMNDKNIDAMLQTLKIESIQLYLTQPKLQRAAAVELLEQHVRKLGATAVSYADSETAMSQLMADFTSEDILLVTGSLFLVAEVRQWMQAYRQRAA